jgi:hypothetical protein
LRDRLAISHRKGCAHFAGSSRRGHGHLVWSAGKRWLQRQDRGVVGPLIFGNAQNEQKEINMLWTIFIVLLILWLLGFSLHIAGGLSHLLLVVALVMLVFNLVSGRRVA